MNVTEAALREYLLVFHETLRATANEFLPSEHRDALTHTALLPAKIIGYVSSQFGAGFEYVSAPTIEVCIIRGSSRVEDLLVQVPTKAKALPPVATIIGGKGSYRDISRISQCTLAEGFPFRLADPDAGVRLEEVDFRIGSWQRNILYAEIFGNRKAAFWSKEEAIGRAKDEVLAALTHVNRAEVRNLSLPEYISTFRQRTVLLLGDYDSVGLERLHRIASVLTSLGYDPILVKDFPDQPVQDLSRKVTTIGSLARFVIVDDSSKSGHLAEVQLCRFHNWITVLLHNHGKRASWMTAGASLTSNVILEQDYNAEDPGESVLEAVQWAENKIGELQVSYDRVFPWRA